MLQPGTLAHVPVEHAVPGVHTRRQRLLTQASPRPQLSVVVHVLPVDPLPRGPQSVNSVAREVSSSRQPPTSAQPSDGASQRGSHGREQSAYEVPETSNAQRPARQCDELVQYSRQKPSVVHVCSAAQCVVLKQVVPARPVPAVTQVVVEPVHSHFCPVEHSVFNTGSHGIGSQVPDVVQRSPAGHVPQLPPQPSLPQTRPVQLGVQIPQVLATPAPPQVSGKVHDPQSTLRVDPQRSLTEIVPQSAPSAAHSSALVSGTHPHWFGVMAPQVAGGVHDPQEMERAAPHRSVVLSIPQLADSAVHSAASVSGRHSQVPDAAHVVPDPHVPHEPPQPSGPHS